MRLVTKDDKYILLFDIHHTIGDGLSLSILLDELCKLYNREKLPSLSLDYVDYAEWEQNLDLAESKNFWINQFRGDIPVLELPTDYPRPIVQSFEGDKVCTKISSDLAKKIQNLTKNLNVSSYVFLLSAYYVLLYKYSNSEDIVVGSPVLGRNKEELLNMVRYVC